MTKPVIIGDATLYLGDCAQMLPLIGQVDAVITDPPYGIGADAHMHKKSGEVVGYGSRRVAKKAYEATNWDTAPPSADFIAELRAISEWQAFFGGNYIDLPPSSCWLVWDKMNGANDFADCELVWTNWKKPVRRLQHLWSGFARAGNEERFNHPTQKPIRVMTWVIELCPKADLILDPYMGSGTTGVAALQMGRKFVGIEREEKYFEIACKRIEAAVHQGQLFEPEERRQSPIQESFL